MSAPVVEHAYSDHPPYRALCRQPGGAASGIESRWTCKDCLRLVRLMQRAHAAARRLRREEDLRVLLAAVVPGATAIDLLTEPEARRVLTVLEMVAAAERRRR